MRKPLLKIFQGHEIYLMDDYTPGFREAGEEANSSAIGYNLR